MLEGILAIKGWKLFFSIIFMNLLLMLISEVTLINETVFFNTYSEQLTYDLALDLFQRMRSFTWVTYLLIPLLLSLKFLTVSIVIYIGVFFYDLHKAITLGKIFKVVIVSEIAFIAAALVKLLWFIFFAGNYTLDDISFFYPVSLINIFSRREVSAFWIYPLQTVNIFQFIYVLLLALGLKRISSVNRKVVDRIVLATYVPAITVWVALVMFFTIDSMP
jgi:hypothetical protein